MKRAWILAAVGTLLCVTAACPQNSRPPGKEVMGTFAFTATMVDWDGGTDGGYPPTGDDCPGDFDVLPQFDFDATLSRDPAPDGTTEAAYLTYSNVSRSAGFDGVVFESVADGGRQFTGCTVTADPDAGLCLDVTVVETFRVALLNAAQVPTTGTCPGGMALLDAGLAADGGSYVLACGQLRDDVQVPDTCAACRAAINGKNGSTTGSCRFAFDLSGKRQ